MKSPIRNLAAAAAIIIAVFCALNLIGNSGDALAEVLDNVNQIRSYAYRIRITEGQNGRPVGKQDNVIWEQHILESRDYGRRTYWYWVKGPEPIPVKTTEPYRKAYSLTSEGVTVSVNPGEKTFSRTKLPGGPQNWQGYRESRMFMKGFTNRPYTRLGRDTIDGIQTELFKSTHPDVTGERRGKGVARLWIDTKTKLPVRMEVERFAKPKDDSPTKKFIHYGFEWNVEIDAADFDPNIPDDYIELFHKGKPPFDEKKIVTGLRFFAEITGGKYPSVLSGKTVYEELNAAWIAKYGVPLEKQSRREDIRKTLWLDATIGWYDNLKRQDKDPAYYGDKVTAESPHAVLMRWKMDDRLYKVIFGNLIIKEATPDELAELEKSLPQ